MHLLRAATISTTDPGRSEALYGEYFGYRTVESGTVDPGLAASWGVPSAAGRQFLVMRPESGADIFVRFVAGDPVPDFRPLRTYGWAAIELNVTDVLKVNERLAGSPFKVIGPPKEIEGLPAIYPMQVTGPDNEVIYLTQIRDNLPDFDLPRASTLVDHLFILVMGCSDMNASIDWFRNTVGLKLGRKMDIQYTMLSDAFGTSHEDLHTISTVVHERDVFLELDQYPKEATPRPGHDGMLPPGVALATLMAPDFDAIRGEWISPPEPRRGTVYGGKRAGTLRAPDGTLVELVER